jgi:hypothetical protein
MKIIKELGQDSFSLAASFINKGQKGFLPAPPRGKERRMTKKIISEGVKIGLPFPYKEYLEALKTIPNARFVFLYSRRTGRNTFYNYLKEKGFLETGMRL